MEGPAQLAALDAATGNLRWMVPQEWSFLPYLAPAVAASGERVGTLTYTSASTDTYTLQALDKQTGTVLWQTGVPSFPDELREGSVLVANEEYLFLNGAGAVSAYDFETGDLEYTVLSGASTDQILLTDDALYGVESHIAAFDPATGTERWSYQPELEQNAYIQRVVVGATTVYALVLSQDRGGRLLAVDSSIGQALWEQPLAPYLMAVLMQRPAVGTDAVFALGMEGEATRLLALSQTDGTPRWHFPMNDISHSPATDGTRAFVTDIAPRWRNWLAHLNPRWH
jgi:outer membrane protein assembly factor BamB